MNALLAPRSGELFMVTWFSLDYFSDPRLHGSLGVGLAALVGGATGIALRSAGGSGKATRARAATRAAPPAATRRGAAAPAAAAAPKEPPSPRALSPQTSSSLRGWTLFEVAHVARRRFEGAGGCPRGRRRAAAVARA